MANLAQELKLAKSPNLASDGWDARRIAGVVFLLAIIGVSAYYLLPILLTMAWTGIKLIVAMVVLSFLVYTVLNPKFRRGIRYLSEALAGIFFGWAVELNSWNILENKLDAAEKDRNRLERQGANLKGVQMELKEDIGEQEKILREAQAEVITAREALRRNPDDVDAAEQVELAANEFENAKMFIEGTKPTLNDLDKLITFCEKAYRKSGTALAKARTTLTMQRKLYNAVTKGVNAVGAALKAFRGDPALNSDAEMALRTIKTDVANKIGLIQSSIQITSTLMNKADLKDAAKVRLAVDMAEKFDDKSFEYAEVITESRAIGQEISKTNKFLDLLNKKHD